MTRNQLRRTWQGAGLTATRGDMMIECDSVLRADIVITQNEQREMLENAAIAIKDGKIRDIGAAQEIADRWRPDKHIDLSGCMIMPALVNAHAHTSMTFLRGLADDQPLMRWLTETIFPAEARLTPEIVRLGALLGHAELLASGCGSCIDMYIFSREVLAAAEISGLRCLGGEAVFAFPSAACENAEEALAETERLAAKYEHSERVKIAVNPHAIYSTTPGILRKCRDLALRHGLPIHIHLAETRTETAQSLEKWHARPVEWAARAGLFDARVIAAHLVDINDEETEQLAAWNVIGVHNPSSNMKLASGAAPIAAATAKKLKFALGTDGPASNNQLNMFAEMRQAALLAKLASGKPESVPAGLALDMATRHGGLAFGLPLLGTLAKDAPADLIALDMRRPNMQPMFNPVSQAVYAATGNECRLTMVAGEILFQDGKFTRFSLDELLAETKCLLRFSQNRR